MAKNTVGDWSTTAGDNTDVGGINIAEGWAPSNINNSVREIMAQIATTNIGDASKVVDKSSDYTAVLADRGEVIRGTAAMTLNLTTATTLGNGWYIDVVADGGDVTIDPNGAETIDGAATFLLEDGKTCRAVCSGTAFFLQFKDTSVSGITSVVDDTTPQLGGQLDVNGQAIGDGTNELLTFTEDASAVNHVNIENQSTGSGPIISAAGDDADIDLNIKPKGTGRVRLFDPNLVIGSDANGDMYYRAANKLTRLAKGTADQVLTMNTGATAPEWADAQGGWRQIGTNEPTTDVSEVAFTGLSGNGYRSVRIHGALHKGVTPGSVNIQVRASGGTWRTVATTASVSAFRAFMFDFKVSNLDAGAAANFVICSGHYLISASTGIDRSSDSLGEAGGDVSAGYSSHSETIDEIRIQSASGNFEGSTADQRGVVILEAI